MSKKNKGNKGVAATVVSAVAAIATMAKHSAAITASVYGVRHAACLLPRVAGSKRAQAIACLAVCDGDKHLAGLLLPLCGTMAHNAACRSGNDRAIVGEITKAGDMKGYIRYASESPSEKSVNESKVLVLSVQALYDYVMADSGVFGDNADAPVADNVSAETLFAVTNFRNAAKAKATLAKLNGKTVEPSEDATIAATVENTVEATPIADKIGQ